MRGLVGHDQRARALIDIGAAPPPIGHHATGFLHEEDARCRIDKAGFLEIAGEPAHGDIGAAIGGAADHAHRADRRANGVEALVEAGIGVHAGGGHAGADVEHARIDLFADLEPFAIEEGAVPGDGDEHLIGWRIVEHAADRLIPAAQGQGNGVVHAIDEIGRAVDGIDQPAVFVVVVDRREFLAGKAEIGIALEEVAADEQLALLVRLGDEIGRALDTDLEIAEAGEIALGERASLAGNGDHVFENGLVVHAGSGGVDSPNLASRRVGPAYITAPVTGM